MHYRYIAVENIVRKGEIACDKQFLHFTQCFLPYMALSFHLSGSFGLYQEENATDRRDWNRKVNRTNFRN